MHGARQQWRDDGNGLVERSSDRAASWSVSEVRASRSRRDLPTDFRVVPEVELQNSLFFEKNSLLGLQNSPFHCSSSGTSSHLSDCVPEYLRSMVVRQGHISSR